MSAMSGNGSEPGSPRAATPPPARTPMRALPPMRDQEPTEEEWAILAQLREQRARAAEEAARREEERGRMRPDQLAELLRSLDMEEPHDRNRSRRDEMTPRRAVRFVEIPEREPEEELRTDLDEAHNLPGRRRISGDICAGRRWLVQARTWSTTQGPDLS
eukprot:3590767-Rhodomonas_salina.1